MKVRNIYWQLSFTMKIDHFNLIEISQGSRYQYVPIRRCSLIGTRGGIIIETFPGLIISTFPGSRYRNTEVARASLLVQCTDSEVHMYG